VSDTVFIPIFGVGLLVLNREAFDAAVAAGKEYSGEQSAPEPMPDSRLLDSKQMADKLGVPKTWLEQAARNGDVPVVQVGKYRRFDPVEVFSALRATKGSK
jgi:hypothetical protein